MDFYARKMPYQCIEHMGDALKPTQKLQMYCDIAKHFDCVDTAKLRLLLGIMFTQRGCVSGHYLGEISKEDFEKLIDDCLQNSHHVQTCEELPPLFGINTLNECYLCPYSTNYKNLYVNEEKEIIRAIYNCTNTTGTITPSAPYLDIVYNAKLQMNSMIEVIADDSPDNGVCVPYMSILLSSSSSWLGYEQLEWFIENILTVQLTNVKVNTFYSSPSITRLMTTGEITKCIDLFRRDISGSNNIDIISFKRIVEKLKKEQGKKYIPVFEGRACEKTQKKRKKTGNTSVSTLPASPPAEIPADLTTLFLGEEDNNEKVDHLPYSPVPKSMIMEDMVQIEQPSEVIDTANSDDTATIQVMENMLSVTTDSDYDQTDTPNKEKKQAMPDKTASPESLTAYMKRIEDPLTCINIVCQKQFFSQDEKIVIIQESNKHIEELTLFKELTSRKTIICDAVTMDNTTGLLLYFDNCEERSFNAQFYFIEAEAVCDKIISVLKNAGILKLTLSPFALQKLFAERCMCQNIISLCDMYVVYKADAATLKKLVDGKGTGDHLIRAYKNMYTMCAQFLNNPQLLDLSKYHTAIAMSLDADTYISNASIDYDGYAIHYNYDNGVSQCLVPGIIFSISDIELDMNSDVGIPEITRAVIIKLYNGRYIYDEKIKILTETSNGMTFYIPEEKDAYSVIDIINRITVKTIRELTHCKPVYAISIHT